MVFKIPVESREVVLNFRSPGYVGCQQVEFWWKK